MQVYNLLVTKTDYGYLATQKEFDFAIDADTLEHAITAAKRLIEQEGVLKMKAGEHLPVSDFDEETHTSGEKYVFVQVDIDKAFRESATESVRKNISLPAWMDIRLRYYDVDASRLFQDAALAFLETKESEQGYTPIVKKITSVDELVENVDKKVLDAYVMQKLLK